jgi:CRP/FNR family cyclic AMP-dependent transcriptional regulator
LHGTAGGDFSTAVELVVWAEALTAIGAALAKRMIPLRTVSILNNVFGVAADLKIEWLKPFMHPRKLNAGARVFSKGDEAKEAFVLVEGRIVIPENSAAIEPGAIFGEMALFTATGRRTASAVCASDVRLLVITYEQFEQLYFQNPEFGLYLVRLIVRRFERNHAEPDGASVAEPFAI